MRFLFPLLFFLILGLSAQELPPIQNFVPEDYNGENQNWAIAQASNKFIYTANNNSLLEFDGVNWRKYPSPNASVIRALAVSDEIIYTGCYMEFGYWQKDGFGNLNYTSLVSSLKEPLIEDEQFWNIITVENWVLFQSLNRIYIYNTTNDTFEIVTAETAKAHIFNLKSGIYFKKKNTGVFRMENKKSVLVTDDERICNQELVGLFDIEGGLLYLTNDAKFYRSDTNGKITRWAIDADSEINGSNLYTSLKLDNGSYVLGTITNGLYQISPQGKLIRNINQQKGLNNNTILSLFEDMHANLWLGHDNGLSVVNLRSPFNEHIDKVGKLGVVYVSKIFKDYLYLGTNQGLFFKKSDVITDFQFIKGTEGQVWSLTEINGTLFCGHNNGTYIVKAMEADLIANFPGTWNVKSIPNKSNYLLQGNYDGLSILEEIDGKWQFRNKLEGFDHSSRFFEFSGKNEIIVNHEYKGVFRLKIDPNYQKVDLLTKEESKGYGSSLFKYKNKLVYTTQNGIFALDDRTHKFVLDSAMTNLFTAEQLNGLSIMIKEDEFNKLWRFANGAIFYITSSKFDDKPILEKINAPSFLRNNLGVSGFENLSALGNNAYLIGTSNGYVTLDLKKIILDSYKIHLTSVSKQYYDKPSKKVLLDSITSYENIENNIHFSYSVPEFDKYTEVQYQHKLEGLYENWSNWSSTAEISFENLPFGAYAFRARAKVNGVFTENIVSYSFEINRPWYWSITAIISYIIALILFSYIIHKFYKAYYKKQQSRILTENKRKLKRKKIKAQKKIIQINNEKLKQEIEGKNRELAVSTMSIIKKNEFLNSIKSELKHIENENHKIKSVLKTIDKNINNVDDWKFFEEAFNNADKDFLKKIKKIHVDLTSNDLRLCAYLRLNLSSKEIAPLLNISIRSVEVKRYRLRKKIGLAHEKSLVDYILSI